MQENGRGIFYGVIGVATLVVAIIGATFAYFASTASTANNAVNTASANVQALTISVNDDGLKEALIPVLDTDEHFAPLIGTGETKCLDVNGQAICSVYSFTVTNPSTISQNVSFKLEPSINGFANLHYAMYKGTPTTFTDVNGEVVADLGAAAANSLVVTGTQLNGTSAVNLTNLTQTMAPSATVTYTIVLWIRETGNDQPGDVNQTFGAGITAYSGTAGKGVTGVLVAS